MEAVSQSEDQALATGEPHGYVGRIPVRDKISYGLGQFGEGLQNSAAVSLLLFFYSQVIGLNAAVVGAGIMLTGLLNAVLDFFIGSWSDVTRHKKWGRRHPYLYLTPIPAAISMLMLFGPPADMSPFFLLFWLFFWYTIMRGAMSFYMVPHWALGAELSRDYNERIGLVIARVFFSYMGIGGFFIISLLFFDQANHDPRTLLDSKPYLYMGLFIGSLAALSELWSAFGTRRYIPYLPKAPSGSKALKFYVLWRETRDLFTNKAFTIFFVGSLIMALCVATRALDIYMGVYFWRLPSNLTLILPGLSTIAFASGNFFWAAVARRIGKKNTFIAGVLGYGLIMTSLPLLKISGIFFSETSEFYFATILTVSVIGYFILASYGVMSGSILPDVVDDYFRQTGRRMAGIISGFMFVILTVTAACSQLLAGLVLTLIGLAPKALPEAVPIAVSNKLGLVSAGVISVTTVAFFLVFRHYPIRDKIIARSAL